MAENTSKPPPTAHSEWWQQILAAIAAALVPVLIRGVKDALGAVEKQIAPWDGKTDRRAGSAPEATQTP